MSELISGKEAALALINGRELLWKKPEWDDDEKEPVNKSMWSFDEVLNGVTSGGELAIFYLKPQTVNLNGVEVEEIYSSEWHANKPKEVIIEFKTKDGAVNFQRNAMKIFNNI